jgi:hypothetical protein
MTTAKRDAQMEPMEEIARLLAIQIRRGAGSQADAAAELSRVGFGPTRIAQLLGTTAATIGKDLQRARKRGRGATSTDNG